MSSNKDQHLIDHILRASLRLARMKEKNTLETFMKMNDKCVPHKIFRNMFNIEIREFKSRQLCILSPKEKANGINIFFLHGGAYVTNMTPGHWFLIGAMIQKLNCTVIVPDYPLAPKHNVHNVFDFILAAYQEIIGEINCRNLCIMGDSAGGGMALALCQLLHEKGIEQPASLYCLSPWLDIQMNNPDIKELDEKDPILNIQGLIDSGKAYAGSLDRMNYLVSPIYGSLQGLPPIHMVVGTHDIMLADVRRFKQKANNAGVDIDYHEIKGLLHDGMLYPTPEGKACRKLIFSSLKKDWSVHTQ